MRKFTPFIIAILIISIFGCDNNSNQDETEKPQLQIYLVKAWAERYYGYFSISFYVKNVGGGDALATSCSLKVFGSKELPISFMIDKTDASYEPIEKYYSTIKEGFTTLIFKYPGRAYTYIPYYFEISIFYSDKDYVRMAPVTKYAPFEMLQ